MMTFILVLVIGPLSDYRGVAVTHIAGYESAEACKAAVKSLEDQNMRNWKWFCIPGPSALGPR